MLILMCRVRSCVCDYLLCSGSCK